MTQVHPLSFFIDFLANSPIDTLKEEFFSNALLDNHSATYNEREEWRTEFSPTPGGIEVYPHRVYFKDYLVELLNREASAAIQQLDMQLIKEPDVKKAHVRLAVYLSKMDTLTEQIAGNASFRKYPAIKKTYQQLSQQIRLQSESLGLAISKPVRLSGKKSGPKLQWTDTCKSLTQLFYALYYEERNRGKPFIQVSKPDLVHFLAENFVGKDGMPYEKASIDDGLKPRSIARRAKNTDVLKVDEIVPNKKLKIAKGTR